MPMHEGARSETVFSADGRYRYWLAREWDASLPRIAWIMLNPSTADMRRNDPTVERVEGFSDRWGFGSYVVVNLYAFRATEPRDMLAATNPAGLPLNASYLAQAVQTPALVLAWGVHGGDFARTFSASLPALRAGLDQPPCVIPGFRGPVTGGGDPLHPLYLKSNARPLCWEGYGVTPSKPWPLGFDEAAELTAAQARP